MICKCCLWRKCF